MRENTWPGEGRGAKDIPALEFIVFLRPVKSRILTLLVRRSQLSSLNYQPASGTLIQYFKKTTDFEIQPPTKTPLTLPQVIENIWQNVDRDYHVRILAKRLRRIEKDMNADARTQSKASNSLHRTTP